MSAWQTHLLETRSLQTFLPYESFSLSANVLDMRRLGKQRVEVWQIWLTTQRTSGGWINHPAVRMWRGHEWWLLLYGAEMCVEWRRRGYRDSLLPRFIAELERRQIDPYPPWLGLDEFHVSHRGNLLRKDMSHYATLGWVVDHTVAYYWPV